MLTITITVGWGTRTKEKILRWEKNHNKRDTGVGKSKWKVVDWKQKATQRKVVPYQAGIISLKDQLWRKDQKRSIVSLKIYGWRTRETKGWIKRHAHAKVIVVWASVRITETCTRCCIREIQIDEKSCRGA